MVSQPVPSAFGTQTVSKRHTPAAVVVILQATPKPQPRSLQSVWPSRLLSTRSAHSPAAAFSTSSTHRPRRHTGVEPPHTLPQPPQFSLSVSSWVHAPSVASADDGQQAPMWSVPHWVPHEPQLLLSVSGSLQAPVQQFASLLPFSAHETQAAPQCVASLRVSKPALTIPLQALSTPLHAAGIGCSSDVHSSLPAVQRHSPGWQMPILPVPQAVPSSLPVSAVRLSVTPSQSLSMPSQSSGVGPWKPVHAPQVMSCWQSWVPSWHAPLPSVGWPRPSG